METMWTYRLVFCGPNEINHFYCADPPLLKLACSDTKIKETSMLVGAGSNLTFSLLIILVSYLYIFSAIPRMHSTGRCKAFSICCSHLTNVTIFYVTLFIMYLRPPFKGIRGTEEKSCCILYHSNSMLNLMIYSLRNKDVKEALTRELFRKIIFS